MVIIHLGTVLLLFNLTVPLLGVSVFDPPAAVQIFGKPGDQAEFVSYKPIDYKSVSYIMQRYDDLQKSNEALNGVAEIAGEVAHGLIDVIDAGLTTSAAFHGNIPLMIGTHVGKNLGHGLVNKGIKAFEEHGAGMSKELLLDALNKTYDRVPNFDKLSTQEQYTELMKSTAFESKYMKQIINDHEHNAIFQTYMMQNMSSELYKLAINAKKDRAQMGKFQVALAKEGLEMRKLSESDTAEIISQIEKVGKAVIEIDKKRYSVQQDVLEANKKLVDGITEVAKNPAITLDDVNKNVNVVKAMMFTRLTTEEQQAQLRSGNCDDIFGENKDKIQLRVDFEVATSQLFSVANSAVQIGSALGIKPKIIADVSKAIAVGQAASSFTLSVMSSNPIGMISSTASLIGVFGKQTDPAMERHKELMEGISQLSKQIAEGNAEIRKDLVEIKDMLREINKNIIILDKKITYTIAQLKEVNARLHHIDNNIVEIADVIIEMEFQHYKTCSKRLIEGMRRATSRSELRDLLTNMSDYDRSQAIKSCVKGFDLLFAPDDQSPFFRNFATYSESQTGSFRTNYKAILSLLGRNITSVSVSKLIKPNSEYYALDLKRTAKDLKRVGFTWEAMINPVAPERVVKAVDDYLTFYPVTYMFNQDKTGYCDLLPDAQDREVCKSVPGNAYRSLREALALIQIAIAQQTVTYGDLALYPIIEGIKSGDENFRVRLEEIMVTNPGFAKNLLLVYISEYVSEHHPHPSWYRVGLNKSYGNTLSVLELPWKLNYETVNRINKVYFEVNPYTKLPKGVKIYLPTEEEYNGGYLVTSPELPRLLQLRKRVVNDIVDMQTFKYIQESDDRVKQGYLDLIPLSQN